MCTRIQCNRTNKRSALPINNADSYIHMLWKTKRNNISFCLSQRCILFDSSSTARAMAMTMCALSVRQVKSRRRRQRRWLCTEYGSEHTYTHILSNNEEIAKTTRAEINITTAFHKNPPHKTSGNSNIHSLQNGIFGLGPLLRQLTLDRCFALLQKRWIDQFTFSRFVDFLKSGRTFQYFYKFSFVHFSAHSHCVSHSAYTRISKSKRRKRRTIRRQKIYI